MGKFFNLDAPVIRTLGTVGEIMMITALWLLCCLPVLTVGASTAALYRLMFNLKAAGSTKVTDFFKAFRENFKKATLLWLVLLAAALALTAAYYLVLLCDQALLRLVLVVLFCLAFLVFCISAVYVFPLTAYFENTLGRTLRNALAMGMGHLRRSIPACALAMLPVVAMLLAPNLFLRLMFLWIFLAPGAIAYGIVCILLPVFRLYSPEEAAEAE